MTDEEFAERVDEMAVMFNTPAWNYFLDLVEEMSDHVSRIEDMRSVEDLYHAKGYKEALARVLSIESVLEQSREDV